MLGDIAVPVRVWNHEGYGWLNCLSIWDGRELLEARDTPRVAFDLYGIERGELWSAGTTHTPEQMAQRRAYDRQRYAREKLHHEHGA